MNGTGRGSCAGILHFGPGAFHRAHQADYIDRLLDEDSRWGIAAVSLRSRPVVDALACQHGRYTLAILDAEPSFRTLSAHVGYYGPGDEAKIRAQLCDPAIRIITSTVTEKGYCLDGDGALDFGHPDIVHDLARPKEPISVVGWLALGLGDRREARHSPFTPLCCDNMASNGKKLGRAVQAFAERLDPDLAAWIAGEVRFPETMVDSITPATDDRLRALVHEATGHEDSIPVSREAYSAWIIEDALPPGSPDLGAVGAVLTADVGAYERAKLRILNGAHSSLAYLGLLLGHDCVAQAMDDEPLARFVERLVRDDIIPSLRPSPLDLDRYSGEILTRFRNPAIAHKLAQIAWDGSQKLPYRLLDTIADAITSQRLIDRLVIPIAAWILFIESRARRGDEIVDPLASCLSRIGRSSEPAEGLLELRQIFPARLAEYPPFRTALFAALATMRSSGPLAALTSGNVTYARS